MVTNRFTALLHCRLPLQQAAMGGGIATPELAAAVARAGGLGMVSGGTAEEVRASLAGVGGAGLVGVGFLAPFLDRAGFEVAAELAPVVEVFWGPPDPELVAVAKSGGALASWQVGSVADALAAADAGCALVVVQGVEAGGHVEGAMSLQDLVPAAVRALGADHPEVVVIAAGGIGTAADAAAAFAAGADAIRVGTRFVAAVESGAHPLYVDALVSASAADTVLTEAFSVFWPDAPHRVLRSAVEAASALEGEVAGTIRRAPEGADLPVPRFASVPPDRHATGAIGAMALYAGTSVDGVAGRAPAAEIMNELLGDLVPKPTSP